MHTERALENFPLAGRPVHGELVAAYGTVKLACALTNRALGAWAGRRRPRPTPSSAPAARWPTACSTQHVVVDRLQGGAGTSTNMNVNEVLANRALELLGEPHGDYDRVSPLDDINLHQSTNDTYPTALRLAAIRLLHGLEEQVRGPAGGLPGQGEGSSPTSSRSAAPRCRTPCSPRSGREMGAYAEALNRDRWRIYKCEERLRVVNLGGTAIGTGFAAPRQYIFRVVDTLRELTGIGFARAENLGRGHPERRRVRRGLRHPQGARRRRCSRSAATCACCRPGPEAGLGEIRLPRAAGRLVASCPARSTR